MKGRYARNIERRRGKVTGVHLEIDTDLYDTFVGWCKEQRIPKFVGLETLIREKVSNGSDNQNSEDTQELEINEELADTRQAALYCD